MYKLVYVSSHCPSIGLIAFIAELLSTKRIRVVRELHHLWNFDALMDKHLYNIGGFATTQQSSGMHEFHIKKDDAGEVRWRCRQSSQASTWLPEGEGDLLFKSVPSRDEAPPIAKPKLEADTWRKANVHTNVRRWLLNLGLSCEALSAAEIEWEKAFEDAVDDTSTLPPEKCLVWKPLPVYAAAAWRVRPDSYMAGSRRDMVENPVVNPIYGAGRSSNQVCTELHTYQQEQRILAENSGEMAPIFLGEYLFLWIRRGVQQGSVVLGRVCGIPAGGALKQQDCVDVLEYEHTPQPGYNGFFGVFEARKNTGYDGTKKGSCVFIRHRDVPRSDILCSNVKVFVVEKALRVQLSSLRTLSCAVPATFPMPDTPPRSHSDGCSAGAPSRQPQRTGSTSSSRQPSNKPVVSNGSRISVRWTEDPVGWFAGSVTSSRREDNTWVSRVLYDSCYQWAQHGQWHYLDPAHADAVEWKHVSNSDAHDSNTAPAAPRCSRRAVIASSDDNDDD